jgi:transposase
MSHATHANAALTPRARVKLARLIVDAHWPPARAAERYDVSYETATKWADLYQAEGAAGILDRSSRLAIPRRERPHRGERQPMPQ